MNEHAHEASFTTLDKACRISGITLGNAEPLHLGAGGNDIWRLPGGIVARVKRPGPERIAALELRAAHWLTAQGIPTVRPHHIPGPFTVDGRPITFWQDLGPHTPGHPAHLGNLLRRLHSLQAPSWLPTHDPFVRLADRMHFAAVNEDDKAWLKASLKELREIWWGFMPYPGMAGRRIVHGDAWAGNVVLNADGPHLLDLEHISAGHAEWDAAVISTTAENFDGPPGDYDEFVREYGQDVRELGAYPLMRDVRSLSVTVYALAAANSRPELKADAWERLACIQGRRGLRPWGWQPVA
jgi:aminoglycoside phosphotransferase (APT) family kinase protein